MYPASQSALMTCGCAGGRSLVPVAEDQGEQVALTECQRRKRVHHLLDISVQVLFVAARGTASAALAWPCLGIREASLIRASSGTGGEALTSVRDGRPGTGRDSRDNALDHGWSARTRRPGRATR